METDLAFYPVFGDYLVRKGTVLVLETRRNDARFICDAQRELCIETEETILKNTEAAPAPGVRTR